MSIPTLPGYAITPEILPSDSRVQWAASADRSVLLIHDMQQYFLDFYRESDDLIDGIIARIQSIKESCVRLGIPVVYTAQPGGQDPNDRALLTDFWGAGLRADPLQTQVTPKLQPEPDDIVLTKWRYSAFQRSDLLQRMHQWRRDQLIVVGIYTHIGCQQTVVDAFMKDIQAFLVGDATADFSFAEHQYALQYVATRAGRVLTTAELQQQLTANAEVA